MIGNLCVKIAMLFLLLIFLSFGGFCLADDTVNNILTFIMDSGNEISRLLDVLRDRPDFNQWFLNQPSKLNDAAEEEYDFIIVGSGSAGAVIANRLSEVKKWKILLLEAGIPETSAMGIPMLSQFFQFSSYNWKYVTESQKNALFGLNDRRMYWPRGKALGGSTTINYMIYCRGNRWDYDRWAAEGNPGWSYEEVLPYFIKSENATNLIDFDPRFHGTNGPQSVESIYRSKLVDTFIEAGLELGLNNIDYNADVEPYGVSRIQANVKKGRRHSTATAFLLPIRNRPNLDIIIDAYVTKVLINPETKEGYGVRYEKNGRKYTARAKKEVILSAGVFNSPQLLMLSGIGPKQHLEKLHIPVIENLPVGQNLQDHLIFPGLSFEINETLGFSFRSLLTMEEFIVNGTGPLTSLGGIDALGFIKSAMADHSEDYPDIELALVSGTLASDFGLVIYRGMNIKDEVFDSIFKPLKESQAWTIFPVLLYPKSVGYMELSSKNPRDYPRFFANYFSDPNDHDINTFLEGIRIVQRIANTTAFQRLGSRLNPRPMYGCDHLTFDSDNYWRCCLRSISVTIYHQVGTAKMGPPDDPTAVVNPNLQVYGIKNLRVADTSIIPREIGGHTSAPAIMVGEKASDIIKEFWGELNSKNTS